MPRGGRGGRGAGGARGRGRGRGGGKMVSNEIEALVEDDDDMSLVPIAGGRTSSSNVNVAQSQQTVSQEDPNDTSMGLGLGHFGTGMQLDTDPFSSFSSIGSIDPLGNSSVDPFIQNMEINQIVSSSPDALQMGSGTDMHVGLIPEQESAPPPKPKNKGGRKPKPKEPALLMAAASSSSSSGAASAAGRPVAPLALANFAFHSPPTPIFHRLPLLVANSGTTAHLSSLTKAVSQMSSEELVQLAKELAGMGRDARARAIRTEAELRKLGGSTNHLAAMPDFTDMDEATLNVELAQLQAQALDYDPPGWALESAPSAAAAGGGKRKRPDGTLEDYTSFGSSSATGPASKKKKLGATGGGGKNGASSMNISSSQNSYDSDGGGDGDGAGEGEDDGDGYGSDFETGATGAGTGHTKGKKKRGGAMTEKEKQRQITTFWNDVEEHFAFPTKETLQYLRPRDPSAFYESYSLVSPAKQNSISDPAFRVPQAGENWKDVIERAREEERERIQREKDARAEQQQQQQEQQNSQYMQMDDEFAPSGGGVPPIAATTGGKKKSKNAAGGAVPPGTATTGTGKKKSASATTSASAARAKSLSTALGYMGLDDARIRKMLLDTDKLLGGDKTFHDPQKQSLSMRLASMILECPEDTQKVSTWSNGPAIPSAAPGGKKTGKDTSSAAGKDSPSLGQQNGHPTTPGAAGNQTPTGASNTALQPPPPVTKAKKTPEYSLEKRIEMELKYLGIFSGNFSATSNQEFSYPRELSDRADDELCANLRASQKELSQTLEDLQVTKEKLYPTLCRLTGHTEKLHQLLDAESHLNRAYMQRGASSAASQSSAAAAGKKKNTLSNMYNAHPSASDHAIERALQQWEQTVAHTGTRRQITGYIPDPVDLGGIPRWRLKEYPPKRDYLDVLLYGIDPLVPTPLDKFGQPNWSHEIPPQHPHNPNYVAPPPPPPIPTMVPEGPQPVYGRGERTSYAAALAASEASALAEGHKAASWTPAAASTGARGGAGAVSGARGSSSNAAAHAPSNKHASQHHSQMPQSRGDTSSNGSYPQPPSQHSYNQSSGYQQQQPHSSSGHRSSTSSHGHQSSSYSHGGGGSHGSSIGALPPLTGTNSFGLGGFDGGFDGSGGTGYTPPGSPSRSTHSNHRGQAVQQSQQSTSNRRAVSQSHSMSIGTLPPADPSMGSFGSSDFFGMDDFH